LYFGRKKLEPIADLIGGYILCMQERDGVPPKFLQGFQEFVERRYNLRSDDVAFGVHRHWTDIIIFFTVDDEDAFDTFYRLIDEFYNANTA